MKKIFIFSILFLFVSFLALKNPALELQASSSQLEPDYNLDSFRNNTYTRVYERWLSEGLGVIDLEEELSFKVKDSETKDINSSLTYGIYENVSYGEIKKGEKIYLTIKAPEKGLYELGIKYLPIKDFKSEPCIGIKVNGKTLFNEVSNLNLEVTWDLIKREGDDRYNRYHNELLPYSKSENRWYKNYLDDVNSRFNKPYKLLFNEGLNEIEIENFGATLKLSELYLNNSKDKISYQDYALKYQDKSLSKRKISFEAEDIYSKNNIEVKAGYYKDRSMHPYSYKNTVLNMLDGSSSSRGGMKTTYQIKVEESGLYSLSAKYLQNTMAGLSCGKRISIDGEVPFKEFECMLFPYTKKWKNITLKDQNEKIIYLYLEKGIHEISFETTNLLVSPLIERLYTIMDKVNNLGLKVSSITGSNKNSYTDWDILKYLPTLVEDLLQCAKEIDEIYAEIKALTPSSKEASEVSTLQIAAKQLRRLSKRPNKIHLKLTELNAGSGSCYQLIGLAIGTLLDQPVSFDTFYLNGTSNNLPKATVNIFKRLWFSLKSFFYSFVDDRYKVTADNDDEILEVWVAQSNLYLDIIQSMADDDFTKKEGIEVKVNILPSTQKLILNNATNSNPDVVLSIDSWEPYNYALRGMLEDLSKYEGFDEVTKNIYSNCFTPVVYEDGVYAIPETTGLNILFYRKDILEFLELEPPKTWDDVLKILPILQSYQMNFYHPLGNETSYKNYQATTPIIYGFGGEVFTPNGLTSVLNDEKVIKAIQYETDLFNIFNLPQQVSSFYEHFRSGTLPVGIGTIDMYLQLKYASPELSGQWGVMPVPGFMNEKGEIESWTTAYGKSSILFKKSKMKEEGFKFIKWWNSTETQITYTQNIKMCLGEKYLVIPANIEAFEVSPWDQEIKTQVALAARWSRIPAILPGSYIVEREFSNIWNNVVINKMDVRVAVGKSIDVVNRELYRKFAEFGYVKNNEILKEYVVPNNDNIHNWVKGRDYYEAQEAK